jgi:UDP-3-O-[3-hydroxymyristoyl] glucosamine N-acyltransferase
MRSEVAEWVGVSAPALDGEIAGVSSIEAATPDSVVFAIDDAALAAALKSKAGIILAGQSLKSEGAGEDSRVWRVKDARYAFAIVGKKLKKDGFEVGVHP